MTPVLPIICIVLSLVNIALGQYETSNIYNAATLILCGVHDARGKK